ncbi:MAG: YihY family inner membrane protein [Candidatus Poribacteria bacterium]|nr:YihY family inner membrane protein [Candidatus Poribacteria bacterium]
MLHLFRSFSINILEISENVLHQFRQHKCPHQAASLAFNTLLCLVPLSAVALFLLKTFGVVENEDSPLIAALNNFLPRYRADEIVTGISEFTNRNLTGLGIGGFLLFLVISLILFMSIEDHFNFIWGSRKRLPLVQAFQKYLVFYMLLLIGPLVIWFLFSAITNGFFAYLFPWISVYFLFFLMYVALPNTTVNWKAAMIGAFLAGTLFQIARIVFAYYFESVWQNYSEIYGTFAMLIILAIWIYVTWIIILLGVEVTNSIQQTVDSKKPFGKMPNENHNYINAPGIITLFLIVASHFHRGKGACSAADVATTAKVPESLVQRIFDYFKDANLIYEVQGDTKGYLPARSLSAITLDSLVTSVDKELMNHFTEALQASPELIQMFQELQGTQTEILKEITVSSLLENTN